MRFLSREDVKKLTLYSHTHRLRMETAGTFPKRKKLGNGPRSRAGYVAEEVYEWMRSKGYPIPEETNDNSSK